MLQWRPFLEVPCAEINDLLGCGADVRVGEQLWAEQWVATVEGSEGISCNWPDGERWAYHPFHTH